MEKKRLKTNVEGAICGNESIAKIHMKGFSF
jgi:hypothetical protein